MPQRNKLVEDFIKQGAKFDKVSAKIREASEKLLKEFFGPRCKEFEPDCICCQRYKAMDDLLENPFKN